MHKFRLPRQDDLGDTIQKCASSSCGASEADPAYLGYWSKEEILRFLEDLLEGERIGAKAFAAIGRAANLQVADLVFDSELAQGAICVLLKKEIVARGGADTFSRKSTVAVPIAKCGLRWTITFAQGQQTGLAEMIEDAV